MLPRWFIRDLFAACVEGGARADFAYVLKAVRNWKESRVVGFNSRLSRHLHPLGIWNSFVHRVDACSAFSARKEIRRLQGQEEPPLLTKKL